MINITLFIVLLMFINFKILEQMNNHKNSYNWSTDYRRLISLLKSGGKVIVKPRLNYDNEVFFCIYQVESDSIVILNYQGIEINYYIESILDKAIEEFKELNFEFLDIVQPNNNISVSGNSNFIMQN